MIGCFIAVAFAAGFSVEVAPDQPIPHAYADEPIVVELTAAEDTTATVKASLARAGTDANEFDLGTVQLRARSPHWLPLPTATLPMGDYRATITLIVNGESLTQDDTVCILERPDDSASAPAVAALESADFDAILAVADAPLHAARISTGSPEFTAAIEALTAAGVTASVAIAGADETPASAEATEPAAGRRSEARAEALARDLGGLVTQWELPSADPDVLMRSAMAIRRGGSRAPVLAEVDSTETVNRVLHEGAGKFIAGFAAALESPDSAALLELRAEVERNGYERLPLHYTGPLPNGGTLAALQDVLRVRAFTSTDPLIPQRFLYERGELQPAYVFLSGMAHRLGRATYVGPVDVANGEVHAFRDGASWIVAAWADDPTVVPLSIGEADDVKLTDGCNNPIPFELDENAIALDLGEAPVYLSGAAGSVMATAATATATSEAEALLALIATDDHPLAAYEATVESVAGGDAAAVDRLQFVGLLQGFPDLERQWHTGAVNRAQAVPAAAALARLVRVLCILEQEEGEEFVESLQNIVARCGEYQSVYLMGTGTNGSEHERGDWLLEEVNRLVHEAEMLREAGRGIEAVGVASVAEARARALEFAAIAKPLSEPEPDSKSDDPAEEQTTES